MKIRQNQLMAKVYELRYHPTDEVLETIVDEAEALDKANLLRIAGYPFYVNERYRAIAYLKRTFSPIKLEA
jgi:hypothetical protein